MGQTSVKQILMASPPTFDTLLKNTDQAGKERDKISASEHDDSHSKCYTDLCSEYEPNAALVEAEWGKDPIKLIKGTKEDDLFKALLLCRR